MHERQPQEISAEARSKVPSEPVARLQLPIRYVRQVRRTGHHPDRRGRQPMHVQRYMNDDADGDIPRQGPTAPCRGCRLCLWPPHHTSHRFALCSEINGTLAVWA